VALYTYSVKCADVPFGGCLLTRPVCLFKDTVDICHCVVTVFVVIVVLVALVVVVVVVIVAIVVVVVTSGSLWPRADCQATNANGVEYGRRPGC